MSLQALIFDVDGTLANTEHDGHLRAFNEAFEVFGLDWYWDSDLYGDLLSVSGGKERLTHYISEYSPSLDRSLSEYTKANNFEGALVVLDHLGEEEKPFLIINGTPSDYSMVSVDYIKELYERNR